MNKALLYVSVLSFLTLSTLTANASAPVYELGGVVVTATATPNAYSKAPASVSVVTREEIEANHYQTLSEALQHVSGIDSVVFGEGSGFEISGESSLTIRGTSNVKVAIDGVIQKTGNSYKTYLMHMNMDDVERIEVLKGAASTLYGADATGGVVNIVTRKPNRPEGNLTVSAGSGDSRNYHVHHSGSEGNVFWSMSYDKTKKGDYTDGYGNSMPRGLDSDAVNLRLGMNVSPVTDLSFTYQDILQNGLARYETPGKGYRYWSSDYRFQNAGMNLRYHSKDGKESNDFSVLWGKAYTNRMRSDTKPGWSPVKPWEKNDRDNYSVTDRYYRQLSDTNRISAGFEWNRYSVATAAAPNRAIRETALYVQDEWDIFDRLRLTAGLRYVDSNSYVQQTLNSASLSYALTDQVNVYVSSNEFYQTPSTNAIFGNAGFLANPSIQPESGRSNEAGLKIDFDETTHLDVSVWDRKYDNAIVIKNLNRSDNKNIYVNTDATSHVKGAEVNFDKTFGRYLHANMSYSRLIADNDAQIPRLPKTQVMAEISYVRNSYDIHLQALNRSDFAPNNYFPEGFDSFLPEKNYWVWNISANYKVNDSVKVFAKIRNLFDKGYMSATQYAASGIALDEPWAWYTAQGRSFELGMTYSF